MSFWPTRPYDELTEHERSAVDAAFNDAGAGLITHFRTLGVPVACDGRAERVADQLARWVIESRA